MSRDLEVLKTLLEWVEDDIVADPNLAIDLSASEGGSSEALGANLDPYEDQRSHLLELGELPAVQERFHALLKDRLMSEIQQNPPLFPWESEIHDYDTEPMTVGMEAGDRAILSPLPTRLWADQVQTLLPVALPEKVWAHLMNRGQELVQSSLKEGAKLVRAVEALFPENVMELNQLAGQPWMLSYNRSTLTDFEIESYETATPQQQMVLSLLAAREILGSLTLNVSNAQLTQERQWLTEYGLLSLRVKYEPGDAFSRLQIHGTLPCGGSLKLKSDRVSTLSHRPDGGPLSVELLDLPLHQSCVLEVRLAEQEETPLLFTVRSVDA